MRIMLVISSLRRGGAERVMSVVANYWANAGHQVFLVTIEGKHADAYSVHPEVARVALNLARASRNPAYGLWNNLRRIWRLRAAARRLRPNVVVSFVTHTNLLTLIALFGTRVPVVISERVDPSQMRIGWTRQGLRFLLYSHAAAVVVQTEQVRNGIRRVLPHAKFAVIPNPVPEADPDEGQMFAPLREWLRLPKDAKVVAAMGRLDPQKGFDLLIDAFGSLHKQFPVWHLVIFGEGAGRLELEVQAAGLALTAHVHLPGVIGAARRYLAEADLFVLSSRFEGYPNVLLEAMACGLPVVSFDCLSGPGEIIRNGYNGLLVEAGNVTELGRTMSDLMESPSRREDMGKNARQVLDRFSLDRIMTMWDQLLALEAPPPLHKNI